MFAVKFWFFHENRSTIKKHFFQSLKLLYLCCVHSYCGYKTELLEAHNIHYLKQDIYDESLLHKVYFLLMCIIIEKLCFYSWKKSV